MSVNMFKPQVWAAEALRQLEKTQVYGQLGIINRRYEGLIAAQGDRVKINSIGPVTVSTYTANTDLDAAEELTGAEQWLIVDKSDAFHFQVDDVDAAQANVDIRMAAMEEAGYGFSDNADQYLAALMTAAVPTANTIGTTGAPKTDLGTAGVLYDYLVDLGTLLSENNVPSEGRFVVLPPFCVGLLTKHGEDLIHATAAGDQNLRNRFIGRVAGFDAYESNNVPNTSATKYKVVAGHPMATTYAEQIVKVEAYRPPLRFADAVKGLHVYGAKVVRPSALAMLICNKTS